MSGPDASLEFLSKWLDEHQEPKTKVILIDSRKGNIYRFEAAFSVFVLTGDIDLATKTLSNGNLYVTFPVIGNVNLVADLSGDLEGSIVTEFKRGSDFQGKFTLSLDKSARGLVIKYDFTIKHLGNLADTLSLFLLPPSVEAPSPAQITRFNNRPGGGAAALFSGDIDLVAEFLNDHFDGQTGNILLVSYTPGSKEFAYHVAFSGIFELEGVIGVSDFGTRTNLYLRAPLWGRDQISTISGSLKGGIQQAINVSVARGTIGVKLSGKDVRVLVDLDVKFTGKIKDDVKLFTLPF